MLVTLMFGNGASLVALLDVEGAALATGAAEALLAGAVAEATAVGAGVVGADDATGAEDEPLTIALDSPGEGGGEPAQATSATKRAGKTL